MRRCSEDLFFILYFIEPSIAEQGVDGRGGFSDPEMRAEDVCRQSGLVFSQVS
jgi:hypothetical protein